MASVIKILKTAHKLSNSKGLTFKQKVLNAYVQPLCENAAHYPKQHLLLQKFYTPWKSSIPKANINR